MVSICPFFAAYGCCSYQCLGRIDCRHAVRKLNIDLRNVRTKWSPQGFEVNAKIAIACPSKIVTTEPFTDKFHANHLWLARRRFRFNYFMKDLRANLLLLRNFKLHIFSASLNAPLYKHVCFKVNGRLVAKSKTWSDIESFSVTPPTQTLPVQESVVESFQGLHV